MKPSVYLETTIPSYLTAWRSPELVMAANQEATRKWWDEARGKYELFISALVIRESRSGDSDAAKRRLEAIEGLPELAMTTEVEGLASRLLSAAALPEKAKDDSFHIAVAAIHGIDYLLTWNCKHIANATMRLKENRVDLQTGRL